MAMILCSGNGEMCKTDGKGGEKERARTNADYIRHVFDKSDAPVHATRAWKAFA